jgi:hypothetical protein
MQRRRALPRERREQGDGGGEAEEMDGLGLWREGERERARKREDGWLPARAWTWTSVDRRKEEHGPPPPGWSWGPLREERGPRWRRREPEAEQQLVVGWIDKLGGPPEVYVRKQHRRLFVLTISFIASELILLFKHL